MKTKSIQSLGGTARAAKLSSKRRSQIAKEAAKTRWKNYKKPSWKKKVYQGRICKLGRITFNPKFIYPESVPCRITIEWKS